MMQMARSTQEMPKYLFECKTILLMKNVSDDCLSGIEKKRNYYIVASDFSGFLITERK